MWIEDDSGSPIDGHPPVRVARVTDIVLPPTPSTGGEDDFFAAAFEGIIDPAAETQGAAGLRAGTHLRTTHGAACVDYMAPGDMIVTASNQVLPIKRLIRQVMGGGGTGGAKCIRLLRGALGEQVPAHDLWLAPQQVLLLDGVPILAGDLLNGVSVLQVDTGDTTILYQVEMETPEILLAEDAPVASFSGSMAAPLDSGRPARDAVQRRIAQRVGVVTSGPASGALRGYLEHCSADRIAGWAVDTLNSTSPVRLSILLDQDVLAEVVASAWRPDLGQAGIGDGRHGFEFRPAQSIPAERLRQVRIIRTVDGAELPRVFELVSQ